MSHGFMSPLPTFTLESLVTSGQWNAAQPPRKKAAIKTALNQKTVAAKTDNAKDEQTDL